MITNEQMENILKSVAFHMDIGRFERIPDVARYVIETFNPDKESLCMLFFAMGYNDQIEFKEQKNER